MQHCNNDASNNATVITIYAVVFFLEVVIIVKKIL